MGSCQAVIGIVPFRTRMPLGCPLGCTLEARNKNMSFALCSYMHPTNDIHIRGCHSIGCGHSDPGHSDVHSNATRSDSRMLTYYVADGLIVANHAHESALGCIALALVRARLRLEGSIPLHLQGYRTTLHLLLYLLLLFEREMTLKRISPQRLKMAGNLCGSRCVELRQALWCGACLLKLCAQGPRAY